MLRPAAMMVMEVLQDSIPMVSLAAAVAALYARMVSSFIRPGFSRLVTLLPVLAFLAVAPLSFSNAIVRGTAAFFLAWLCAFKIFLLAVGGGGPLDPALPVLPFLFAALLPVKVPRRGKSPPSLLSCAVKLALLSALLQVYQLNVLHFYQLADRLHLYLRLALYIVHMYCFLDLLHPAIAAVAGALGMDLEPQFDRPLLASSLRDFWGWRWNLMLADVLRPSVYDPVRARAGRAVGVLASLLVSGLMHEALVYYIFLQRPTGEMTAFYLLHGACGLAEEWCARAVATVLVVVFWFMIRRTSCFLVLSSFIFRSENFSHLYE